MARGLTAAQVTQIGLDSTAPAPLVLAVGALPGIEARTRQYAGILKANPAYTATVGEAYGIAPSAPAVPTVPGLKAAALTQSRRRSSANRRWGGRRTGSWDTA